jgi:hypothetical protein
MHECIGVGNQLNLTLFFKHGSASLKNRVGD